jgi:hypothetical protein
VTDFRPGDKVTARLWPELGTGEILRVSTPTSNQSHSVRVARVHWPTGQESTHAFAALKTVAAGVSIYYCPNSGEWERKPGGGFDTCCDTPERHVPLPILAARPRHVMSCDECRGDLDRDGHFPDCSSYRQEASA